jgi:bifunctional ADP-heptose synthase (sugar kinase/adenylyltransferase)
MKDILIIGESCQDFFVYCDALRIAPDVPVPILNIVSTSENPGMAANVFRNIAKYKNSCDLLTNPNWKNVTKTRYIHEKSNHMFFRVDSNDHIEPIKLDALNLDYKYVVISDYNKGYLSENAIELICNQHPKVFLDTKKPLGTWANSAFYIKINDYEFTHSDPEITNSLEHKIIRTLGSEGCRFKGVNFPVDKVEVKDSSGAGDSFMAALVIQYLDSEDIITSIEFANKLASQIVKQRGVGVI